MNTIPNRQVINDLLIEKAKYDKDVVVLCSDSRGSASLSDFFQKYPKQSIEVGIAEQNLVSISAGLASCGKKVYAASPACFLTTRSLEQIKVDVAYSDNNVKLVGISGGISYGMLGMTHHSNTDIASIGSIPNMRVYIPSDKYLTYALMTNLYKDDKPAYVRVGRNAVSDIYTDEINFTLDSSILVKDGNDAAIIATGELVQYALSAANSLQKKGISCKVIDMYCVKPLDITAINEAAKTGYILTLEEHSVMFGMGAMIAQEISKNCIAKVKCLGLPDTPIVAGNSSQVFHHYGLDAEGIEKTITKWLSI